MQLSHFISNINNIKIMCIGDIMLDRFFYGKVDRISPEAPIPIFLIDRETSTLGGVGNVVHNLVSLNVKSILFSVIGDDNEGKAISNILTNLTNVEPLLFVDKTRKTTKKTRYLSSGQQLLRVDNEQKCSISPFIESRMIKEISKKIKSVDAIILSDYKKGLLTDNLLKKIIKLANKEKKLVAIDPKGNDYKKYCGANILTPNLKGLSVATNKTIKSEDDIINAAKDLIKITKIQNILVTRGRDGMTLVSTTDVIHVPTRSLEVYDVSGAGDTVIATLTYATASGIPLKQAITLANIAAGIVVGKAGTAVLTKNEFISALNQTELNKSDSKITSKKLAINKVENWNRKGYRVGFANGCFDLLHPGHVTLLKKAKNNCDKLIVGLNSDSSIRRIKGKNRPIQSESSRAILLASLEYVDLVVIFEEDTPIDLIKALQPNTIFKGADYKVEKNVVGASFVQSYGGKVMLIDLEQGHSTTNTIMKLIA